MTSDRVDLVFLACWKEPPRLDLQDISNNLWISNTFHFVTPYVTLSVLATFFCNYKLTELACENIRT